MSEVPEFPTMIQNRASLATYLSQSHPRHSSSKSRPLLRILCRRSFGRAVRPEIRAIWKNWTSKTIQNQIINWILRLVEFVIIPSTEHWLVVSTHLKNMSQNWNLPQIGVKINNLWNHHPVRCLLIMSVEPSRRRAMSERL